MGFGEVGFAAISLAMALNLPELSVAIPLVIISAIIIMIISQKKGEAGDVSIALVASRCFDSWSYYNSFNIWILSR